jgi:RecJ-like exonuclease
MHRPQSSAAPTAGPPACLQAASLRTERGPAFCRSCQGSGYLTCNACKGAGILEAARRMNSLRHGVNKLGALLNPGGASPSMHDSDWMVSNRCRRCRGSGSVACTTCGGSGKRGAVD